MLLLLLMMMMMMQASLIDRCARVADDQVGFTE